ncbi:DNA processing protein DprA [Longimycelium tulufanense]|uniref:DNA processing protein DprA n=1 Tax=Longimycelium tulufanense TaxID=907463 RepID=A0A8J3CAE5_9PSEU|nr:DNA-processing protein DprA [Longimycelium tulufanense]GGM39781.1 DNA processing protein DprA [Longimycelium tulufanense]
MTPGERELLLARAYLLRVAEPPALGLTRLIAEVGPVGAARLVRTGEAPPETSGETDARGDLWRPEEDLASAESVGARLVTPEHDEWPSWAFNAFDLAVARGHHHLVGPLALWVRGEARLADLAERAVSIVGARAATDYGECVAGELANNLVQHGITVVSGAAYGIDGAAHRGALAGDGPTVAFLACGIDIGYPAGHRLLLDHVAKSGAVVSEYPPGTSAARHRFLVRNRLIAGFSDGTVVVEAGARSGSRNTAATARTLGRVVMAMPGPVTSAMSVGCHALLREQEADLVTRVAEVIESIGRFGTDLAAEPKVARRPTDDLDPETLRVFDALPLRGGRSPEEVARDSGVPLNRVRALLPTLELARLAERHPEGWRCARPPRPAPNKPNKSPRAGTMAPATPARPPPLPSAGAGIRS